MKFSNIKSIFRQIDISKYIIYIAFLFVFMIFSITLYDSGFLTFNNLMNIGRQSSLIAIVAIGMALVLASGEIDLSVGTNASLATLFAAFAFRISSGGMGIFLSILLPLSVGAVVGLINGLLVSRLRIPSFLATMGMMGVISGVARWVSKIRAIPIANRNFIYFFGGGSFYGIPVLFIWVILFLIIGWIILFKIPLGKKILATGGNPTASFFSGIRVKNIKLITFILSGAISASAGMLLAGRFGGGRYDLGDEMLLTVIAATVLGGSSLFGGKASILGSVFGALLIGMLNNGLLLFGLDIPQQMIIRGVVIILAVAASGIRNE